MGGRQDAPNSAYLSKGQLREDLEVLAWMLVAWMRKVDHLVGGIKLQGTGRSRYPEEDLELQVAAGAPASSRAKNEADGTGLTSARYDTATGGKRSDNECLGKSLKKSALVSV